MTKAEKGRKKVVDELSRLAFMELEEGSRIKIAEKMTALELLSNCLEQQEPPPEEDDEVSVKIHILE